VAQGVSREEGVGDLVVARSLAVCVPVPPQLADACSFLSPAGGSHTSTEQPPSLTSGVRTLVPNAFFFPGQQKRRQVLAA